MFRRILFYVLSLACAASLPFEAQAKVKFPELDKAANGYADSIKRTNEAGGKADAAIAAAKEAATNLQWAQAVSGYEVAIVRGANTVGIWLELARAWHGLKPTAPQSVSAAYNAYALAKSKTDETEALKLLADYLYENYSTSAVEMQSLQEKLKSPASVSGLQTKVEAFREVSDNVLTQLALANRAYREIKTLIGKDNDVVDARAGEAPPATFIPVSRYANVTDKSAAYCIRFNLPLIGDAKSYRPFLTLTKTSSGEDDDDNSGALVKPANVAFDPTTSDRTLCLYGLEHGHTYTLKLSEKFRSRDNRELGTPTDIAFFVGDRAPQARFRSLAFVLPKSSDGMVPLRSVNARSVVTQLVRVTDRALVREIALPPSEIDGSPRKIGSVLDYGRRADLVENSAEAMWTGRIEIGNSPRNEDVHTNLPVMALLKARSEKLQGPTEPNAGGAKKALSVGPMVGEIIADGKPFESELSAKPSAGVYALIARTVVAIPGKLTHGGNAETKDSEAEPESADTQDNAAADTDTESSTPSQNNSDVDAEMPKDNNDDDTGGNAVQWFVVTDIGLTYYEARSKLYVMARSLETGKPQDQVNIQLVSASNRILREEITDSNGVAEFPMTLTQGTQGNRLAGIFANTDSDFSFIDFTRDFFDMSNRGAEGRSPPKQLDGYVYTDRGVYRPGDKIQATVIVRDVAGRAPDSMPPLRLILRGADGKLLGVQSTISKWKLGGALAEISVPENAPLGSLKVALVMGSDKEKVGEALVQVDNFRPDRARLDFNPAQWSVDVADGKATISGSARLQYLYGIEAKNGATADAFAQGVTGEAEFLLRRGKTPVAGCYAGHVFGPGEDTFAPSLWRRALDSPSDAKGELPVDLKLDGMPDTLHPVDLSVMMSTFDTSGILARRSETFILPQRKPKIGVRLEKTPALTSGGVIQFSLLALDENNDARPAQTLKVVVQRERDDFIWVNSDNGRQASAQIGRTEVDTKTVRTDAGKRGSDNCWDDNAKAEIDLPPGRYFVSVTDNAGAVTSRRFTIGWSSADDTEPSPDKLDIISIGADNGHYKAGVTAGFQIQAPFDGEYAVAITDGDIVQWINGQTDGKRRASFNVDLKPEWAGRAFYAVATVFRPGGKGATSPGPARALGAVYFDVDRGKRSVDVAFDTSQFMLDPDAVNRTFKIDILAKGLDGPAEATVFAVDEGILNLTRHPEADPAGFFFGPVALGLGILDSYGRIIQSGRSKSGGDMLPRPERLSFQNYLSDRIVALSYGPVAFNNGKATVNINSEDIGAFDGTLRLVAVVWSAEAVGAASAKIVARSPVVVKLATPRFLANGDTAIVPLNLHNVQGVAGKYAVTVDASSPLQILDITGPGEIALSGGRGKLSLSLAQDQLAQYALKVATPSDSVDSTDARIVISLSGAETVNQKFAASRNFDIKLRPPLAPSVQLINFTLQPGETKKISEATLDDFYKNLYVKGTLQVSARIGRNFGLAANIASNLAGDVPSQSLGGLVMAGQLLLANASSTDLDPRVVRLVNQVSALQANDGGFAGVQPDKLSKQVSSDDQVAEVDKVGVWNSAAAVDFLLNARARGIASAAEPSDFGMQYLSSQLQKQLSGIADNDIVDDTNPCTDEFLYATLVLSEHGRLEKADLLALDAHCSARSLTMVQQSLLAAALKSFGEDEHAKVILAKLSSEPDVYSGQSVIALGQAWSGLVVAGAPPELTDKVLAKLTGEDSKAPQLPVAALAWISRGLARLQKQEPSQKVDVALTPDVSVSNAGGFVSTRLLNLDKGQKAVEIKNTGSTSVSVTLTLRGQMRESEPAVDHGLTIRRRIFSARGEELEGDKLALRQNEMVYIVLEGLRVTSEDTPDKGLVNAVIDTLPTGFEIVRNDIFSDKLGRYIKDHQLIDLDGQGNVRLAEGGDDRWYSIVEPQVSENNNEQALPYRVGYAARPTLAGKFILPPAVVEDFDLPEISASTLGYQELEVRGMQ